MSIVKSKIEQHFKNTFPQYTTNDKGRLVFGEWELCYNCGFISNKLMPRIFRFDRGSELSFLLAMQNVKRCLASE